MIFEQCETHGQLKERENFWQHRLNTFFPIGLNERKSTYINTRTYLNYSFTDSSSYKTISIYLFLYHFHHCVLFIYLFIYLFVYLLFIYLFTYLFTYFCLFSFYVFIFDLLIIFPLYVHKLISISCNWFYFSSLLP